MNERIKQLAEQVYGTQATEQEIKFAQLIVEECVKVAMRSVDDDEPKEAWYLIQEHFGVKE